MSPADRRCFALRDDFTVLAAALPLFGFFRADQQARRDCWRSCGRFCGLSISDRALKASRLRQLPECFIRIFPFGQVGELNISE